MTRRTRGREIALQVLYQTEQNPGIPPEEVRRFIDRRLRGDRNLVEFAEDLVAGVEAHRPRIDALITEVAENWRLDRMAAIDRNILRLGAYEMLFSPDVPTKVAINEALELAKRYSTAQSSRFVNGILDRLQASRGRLRRNPRRKTRGGAASRGQTADRARPHPPSEPSTTEFDPGVSRPPPRMQLIEGPIRRSSFPRADLHVHTTHSDGVCSPCEVVIAAARVGLVRARNHRSRHAFGPGRRPARGGEAGPGTGRRRRADGRLDGREVHILGHFVRDDDPGLPPPPAASHGPRSLG